METDQSTHLQPGRIPHTALQERLAPRHSPLDNNRSVWPSQLLSCDLAVQLLLLLCGKVDQASHTNTAAPGKSPSLGAFPGLLLTSVPIQAPSGLWPGLLCPTPHPEYICPGVQSGPIHPPLPVAHFPGYPGDPGPETSPPRREKPKGPVSHCLVGHRTGSKAAFISAAKP